MGEPPKRADVGSRIAAWRSTRGLSQSTISRNAGIAPSYLSRIENGRVHPTVRTAMRIAAALGVTMNDLLGPSPPDRKNRPCPVSAGGLCFLELIDTGSHSKRGADPERYSPRQIRLLREFRRLVQYSSPNMLVALELLALGLQKGVTAETGGRQVVKGGV